ncbi:ABC transporter ATP-binding protein [Aeromicrobium wangtongii]|uniref:ABC transporter ATP-binding protein n=1 Tax=Aeromicrobium wangtongii TaxID=2969247 RepID=UPI0020183475|nr:ABC transporter ATP-binding protein [Aeromicrobium wangtongii]MCL3820074.1 ABC transporter ATP-binding protein/permease [Aeromicrobium wangtongii]
MSRHLLPIATRGETTRLAASLLRAHRGPLTVAAAAFVVVGLAGLVGPWVLGRIVDAVTTGGDSSVVLNGALLIAGASILIGVGTSVSVLFLAKAGEPALADLREQALDRALHLDAHRLEEAGAGDLLSRVGDDVRSVAQSLTQIVPLLIQSLVAIVFTAGGLFALDWRLGLAGLASAPFYAMGLRWYLPRSGPYYARERIAQGERAQVLVSGVQGASTLRALSRERAQLDSIAHHSRHAMTISLDVFRLFTRFGARQNRSELIGLCLVLGTGFVLVRHDLATVGAVTAAALYFHRLFNPIGALLMIFDDIQSAGASLARLAGVARLEPSPASDAPSPVRDGRFELVGISHEYVPGHRVLSDVTIRVADGERVALVGATGAGKSTLGLIAAGLLRPTAGRVSVGGFAESSLHPSHLRAAVALVTQDVHVFSGTVRDNVDLARPGASDPEIRGALETVRAMSWVDALPDGLDTVVGDHGHRLTPAQAQQLALARVLLHDPLVAVFDEATAEAGSSGARDLEEAAVAVARGRTSLVVAHRLTQARTADRVIVMHEGRIVEEGTHDELVAAGGRYAALWSAWST